MGLGEINMGGLCMENNKNMRTSSDTPCNGEGYLEPCETTSIATDLYPQTGGISDNKIDNHANYRGINANTNTHHQHHQVIQQHSLSLLYGMRYL